MENVLQSFLAWALGEPTCALASSSIKSGVDLRLQLYGRLLSRLQGERHATSTQDYRIRHPRDAYPIHPDRPIIRLCWCVGNTLSCLSCRRAVLPSPSTHRLYLVHGFESIFATHHRPATWFPEPVVSQMDPCRIHTTGGGPHRPMRKRTELKWLEAWKVVEQ